MNTFRTLRGFLAGSEADVPTYFAYSAGLRIFGDTLDFEDISRNLGLPATYTHRKGDKNDARASGFRHDMWSYTPAVSEERPIAEHIDTLWADIRHAEGYLRKLKEIATVDVFLGYRSNIDHAGVQVPYTSLEIFTRLEIPFGISIIIA